MRRPLGSRVTAQHRYVETDVELNPGLGGTISSFLFAANGLYDPNITGVGHQPLGFDEMGNLFQHYTVTKASITVTFVNADAAYSQVVALSVLGQGSTPTNMQRVLEQGDAFHAVVQESESGGAVRVLKASVDISKFMARPSILSEDDFRGTTSQNPVELVYFNISAEPQLNVDSSRVYCIVEIDYTTVWSEPILVAQS